MDTQTLDPGDEGLGVAHPPVDQGAASIGIDAHVVVVHLEAHQIRAQMVWNAVPERCAGRRRRWRLILVDGPV